jgi:hypothetical protein
MKKRDQYMGMDVHQAPTVVVVIDGDGQRVLETIVETDGSQIIRLIQSLSGPLHVTFEETTQAAWLYDMVRHFVVEVIVGDPRRNALMSEGSKGTTDSRCPSVGQDALTAGATLSPRLSCMVDYRLQYRERDLCTPGTTATSTTH